MNQQEMFDYCEWDFRSADEALSLSPNSLPIIRYQKFDPGASGIIQTVQAIKLKSTNCTLEVGTDPFGFYSWLPTDPEDKALLLSLKTKPKPYTRYIPTDGSQANMVCTLAENLFSERGLLTGVSCVKPKNYIVMFAGLAKYTYFDVSWDLMMGKATVDALKQNITKTVNDLAKLVKQ